MFVSKIMIMIEILKDDKQEMQDQLETLHHLHHLIATKFVHGVIVPNGHSAGLPTSAPIGMLRVLAATHLHSSGTEPADLLKPLLLCCNPTSEFYGRDTGNAWGNADTSAPSPVEGCFALVCFVLACHGNVTNPQNFLVLVVEKRNTMLKSQAALLQVKIDSAKSSELVPLLKTVNCSLKPMQQVSS